MSDYKIVQHTHIGPWGEHDGTTYSVQHPTQGLIARCNDYASAELLIAGLEQPKEAPVSLSEESNCICGALGCDLGWGHYHKREAPKPPITAKEARERAEKARDEQRRAEQERAEREARARQKIIDDETARLIAVLNDKIEKVSEARGFCASAEFDDIATHIEAAKVVVSDFQSRGFTARLSERTEYERDPDSYGTATTVRSINVSW